MTYQAAVSTGAESARLDIEAACLRRSVKVEPLIDRWHAWVHLLGPAQQAMNLAHRYVPALESFVTSPSVHAAATQNSEMYGGPFVALPVESVPAVGAYLAETKERRSEALWFAREFREFDRRLLSAAQGYSLNEHKLALPDALKGRVELVYDLNKQPKIKILEEMFDEDDMGLRASEGVFLHESADADRPFFLSTPKFDQPDGLFIEAPLNSEGVMQLCEARSQPVSLIKLSEQLNVSLEVLAPYFTSESEPRTAKRYDGAGVRIRYFGHASILIETKGTALLVDPTFASEASSNGDHLSFDDLPSEIDAVLISHGHQDHMSVEALMLLRYRVKKVIVPRNNPGELADPSLSRGLRNLGFTSIIETTPLQQMIVGDASITTLPFSGEHCDLDVHAKQCFLIEAAGSKVGLFVDSDAIDIDVYRRLAHRLQGMDILFVGMECNGAPLSWLYGPLTSSGITKREDNSRRLSGANCGQASALVELLKPRQAYVYAMGQEPWMKPLMGLNYKPDSVQLLESTQFVKQCISAGMASERLLGSRELLLEDRAVDGSD